MQKMPITGRRFDRFLKGCFFVLFLCLVSGCADTALYTVNIRYEPTKSLAAAGAGVGKPLLTVARFQDRRTVDDHLKVGYVLKSDGRKIFVLPEKKKVSEAVTAGVRDYFYKAGYALSNAQPEWGAREGAIDPSWGDVVVGGNILKLEVVCDDSQPLSPLKNYAATVALGITVADVAKKTILYRTSVEGSATLKDVSFSVDRLQHQLNGVLADVIEKLFTAGEFSKQIKKVAAQR